MYISCWPGLTFRALLPKTQPQSLPYPLSAPRKNSFYVARSGIYHLFRALGLSRHETVLAPDYYSGNEINAIQAAGAHVVHYPIRRDFEADLSALARLAECTRPRVIYVIHYAGWPQPVDEIAALARRYGSILVEDCALSMLSRY